ncbi:ion transporter [Pelagibaculum spongiae]|uniref:Ion transporter n=1 Tax=Pelagibaculum spongiae TaxID=2080658 RepID=A0A2V1GVP4_9GAMM|nr:ion transporter [Pelagibaculum spongiae]PVZ70398.1 ion transporter [Pelagibaculum spongiae]
MDTQPIKILTESKLFEVTVLLVIMLTAIIVGAQTFPAAQPYMPLLNWLDNIVTVILLVEMGMRLISSPSKSAYIKDPWNILDLLILAICLAPIPDGEMSMVMRLLRVFRVARIIILVPELKVLLNSLMRSIPQIGYVLCLLFLFFYIYAVIGTTAFAKVNPELWGDISLSLLTLFRIMTLEGWTDVMYQTMEVYPLSWTYYLSFIFFTAFAFLNMIIGVLVNNLEQESNKESGMTKEDYDRIESKINQLLEQPASSQPINTTSDVSLESPLSQIEVSYNSLKERGDQGDLNYDEILLMSALKYAIENYKCQWKSPEGRALEKLMQQYPPEPQLKPSQQELSATQISQGSNSLATDSIV